MEVLILLIIAGVFGLALGSQASRQPPQITVVQVQLDELHSRGGGCASLIAGALVFVVLAWVLSGLLQL